MLSQDEIGDTTSRFKNAGWGAGGGLRPGDNYLMNRLLCLMHAICLMHARTISSVEPWTVGALEDFMQLIYRPAADAQQPDFVLPATRASASS